DVLALNVAGFGQALPKSSDKIAPRLERLWVEVTDHRHGRPLRPRRKRPRSDRAPEPRDELPPSHSITSSARSKNDSGMVRPIALAVLRFTTSSYLVGNWTGSSPGLVPRRMRST